MKIWTPNPCKRAHSQEATCFPYCGLRLISDVGALLPGLPIPFSVQQDDNQHTISTDLVEHSVGEAEDNASPGSEREQGPCFWKRGNPVQRVLYLLGELAAETGPFSVVEIHSGSEFALRAGQDTNLHRVLIRANMASADPADKRLASYASMRDPASVFQASATRLSSGGSKPRSSSSISSARSVADAVVRSAGAVRSTQRGLRGATATRTSG